MEIRRPSIVDFNADSLRHQLPKAVREVAAALAAAEAGGGRVYVHCTAGLGRAPAVCIAYLYWFQVGGCGAGGGTCLGCASGAVQRGSGARRPARGRAHADRGSAGERLGAAGGGRARGPHSGG